MAKTYTATLDLVVEGETRPPPDPMEALLHAFAGCTGTVVEDLLRRMRQHVVHYQVRLTAERAEEPPRAFTSIHLEHVVTGRGLDHGAVERAVELSAKYCSVGATIRQGTQVAETFRVVEAD